MGRFDPATGWRVCADWRKKTATPCRQLAAARGLKRKKPVAIDRLLKTASPNSVLGNFWRYLSEIVHWELKLLILWFSNEIH